MASLADHVRDGGIVAFQEPANATLPPMSLPHSELLGQVWEWILETDRCAGMDSYMGLRLRSIFAKAGFRRRRCISTLLLAAVQTGLDTSARRG